MTVLSVGHTIESVDSVVVELSPWASRKQASIYVRVADLCLSSLKLSLPRRS